MYDGAPTLVASPAPRTASSSCRLNETDAMHYAKTNSFVLAVANRIQERGTQEKMTHRETEADTMQPTDAKSFLVPADRCPAICRGMAAETETLFQSYTALSLGWLPCPAGVAHGGMACSRSPSSRTYRPDSSIGSINLR